MKTVNLFILLFVPAVLFAQKVTAPPTRIALPSDSLNSKDPADRKIDTDKSPLDLPDVTIYGQDKTQVEIDIKKDYTDEKPTLLKPALRHDPVSVMISSEQNKPGYKLSSKTMDHIFWANILGGGYSTAIADAGFWSKINKGDYRIDGALDYTKGQHENSQHLKGNAKGSLHYIFTPAVKSNTYLEYSYKDLGMYQSYNSERSIRKLSAGTEFSIRTGILGSSRLAVDVSNLSFDHGTDSRNENSFLYYRLYGDYIRKLHNFQFKVYGNFDRESSDKSMGFEITKTSMGNIGLNLQYQPVQPLILSAGVKYQQYDIAPLDSKSGTSPFAEIKFIPLQNLSASASYSSGYEYHPVSEWLEMNEYLMQYFHTGFNINTMDNYNNNIKFNIQYEPVIKMKIFANIVYQNMEYKSWFKSYDDPADMTIYLDGGVYPHKYIDVDILQLSSGTTFNINDKSRLQIELIYNKSECLNHNGIKSANLPYLPEYQIPVKLVIEPISGTMITFDLSYTSERYYSNSNNMILESYTLFNAGISQSFGKISAHVQARNLLDAEYSIWHRYPQNGVYLLAGIGARF